MFRGSFGDVSSRDFLLIRRPYGPADETMFIVPPQFEIHLLATDCCPCSRDHLFIEEKLKCEGILDHWRAILTDDRVLN